MYDCGSLVGLQTETLLEAIQKSAALLKIYETLIMQAPTMSEKKKLGQMYMESMRSLSESASLYMKLTGNTPLFSSDLNPGFTNYLEGIEWALLMNIYTARLYVQLFSTVVPDFANLFIRNSAEKNVHASNLNFIYALYLSGNLELLKI